ncbi:uncharacterized protein SOCE26_102500 [Sorangium cellulosum]|uniref:RNA polymerase sigma-70 region 2 domain-containing protein n=1 Tax=Sorangium cellulosum TaxID=56 RepID=A0A2L0FBA5_SORCE|nr:hypothetical protein [Sorangium cellulosum]AUX48709.1 uncharacterized protein SOCE26_102500 [Sorangium cellulosum]
MRTFAVRRASWARNLRWLRRRRSSFAAPQRTPIHVEPEAILVESGRLRAVLASCGVPAADRDDVLQEVLIGALVAVREDRYRPEPDMHPRSVLRRWLVGIAVHQATKYHSKAELDGWIRRAAVVTDARELLVTTGS